MARTMILSFVVLFSTQPLAGGTNWAQTSGRTDQNVVIPRRPSPDYPHWSERYGAAVVLAREPNGEYDPDEESVIYLMGGDSYDGDHNSPNEEGRQVAFGLGYKNDVWKSTGTEWKVQDDNRMNNEYDEWITRVESQMLWEEVSPGLLPPPGETYDHWLRCELVVRQALDDPTICQQDENQYNVHWSPRRNLGATYLNGYIWVMGGRARELSRLPEEDAIGGIMTSRVKDINRERFGLNSQQRFTSEREVSTYKSDVWRSRDGETWELVTPGCRAPQRNLIAAGNAQDAKYGTQENACVSDEDCYGPAEKCDNVDGHYTCVCQMWSPREAHTVTAYNGYLYVVGGFASRRFSRRSNCGAYACGDVDAGSYRFYLQDVWRSQDGELWEAPTLGTINSFPGRGSHQMIILQDYVDDLQTRLLVIGGEGGNPETNEIIYFNDIWWTYINNPVEWHRLDTVNHTWPPRAGHTAILESPSAVNENNRIIYVVGGVNHDGYLDDTWMWRPDVEGDIWRKDYSTDALFRSGDSIDGLYAPQSPTIDYITPDSDLTKLIKWWLPQPGFESVRDPGLRSAPRILIDEHKLEMLHSLNLHTIRDLAEADKYVILKLRGHDFPGVENTYDYYDICDLRALAIAAVDKCTIVTDKYFYDGEFGMPWNNDPVFGGPAPVRLPAEWHNRDFLDIQEPDDLVGEWDGCEILGLKTLPNVNGLGKVTQVDSIREPTKELQELHCRFNPGARAYHAGLYFEERLYLFGGRIDSTHVRADSWYRDDRMPRASITIKPRSRTPDYRFRFAADEGGCVFEYRLWDQYRFKEIRKWTPVRWYTHVDWLDWRMGGPGNGNYVLYVRAIDPAGNRDERFVLGRNMHYWRYISPTPWDIIFGCVAAFLFLCFLAYAEYRRRVRKAAMERYAMKRMRRKFKAMQRDTDGRAVDWRTLYSEHKELKEDDADGKKRAKEMKKKREKAKLQREKDKQKRDKEKEKIRKKLKEKEKKRKHENTPDALEDAPGAVVVKPSDKKSLEKREMNFIDGSDGKATGMQGRGKTNRYKDYEIDGDSKKDMLPITSSEAEALKKAKSNRFKEYEIDDKSKKDKPEKMPTITDGPEASPLKKGKSNRFKEYEIDDNSKKSKPEKMPTITDGPEASPLKKGKSNRFKEYEIDDNSKKSKPEKMPTITDGPEASPLKKGKSNRFKEYEIDDNSKKSKPEKMPTIPDSSETAPLKKGKSNRFKEYEIDDKSKKDKPDKMPTIPDSAEASPLKKGKSNRFKEYEIDDKSKKDKPEKMPTIPDSSETAPLKKGKSNRFKEYEIDDKSKKDKPDKMPTIPDSAEASPLKKGKSNRFKEYEIDDKSKKDKPEKSGDAGPMKRGKSNHFKEYEVEEEKKDTKGKGDRFKSYEVDEGDSKKNS